MMSNECKPQREGEVPNQISQLERMIEETCDAISSLRSKLTPVLRQQVTGRDESVKTPSALVPLATAIHQCHNRISGFNQDIRAIIEELEL